MFLDDSLYFNERKKKEEHVFGWVGTGKNLEGVGGGGNHDQNILYKKSYFQRNIRERVVFRD